MTACTKNNENDLNGLSKVEAGKTIIEMELDENYDISDSFVNARLFCVSDDIDTLEAEVSFQLDGDSGVLEIKNNKTDEVLWSDTWNESADNDTFTISLNNLLKENEYAIWLSGSKIEYASVKIAFQSDLVQEKERPSK